MPETFDPATISDPATRDHYIRVLKRADALSGAIANSYGRGRKPIRTRYSLEARFNASVRLEQDHYQLELASCVPLFLTILFSKLMCDRRLLPWLPTSGQKVSDFSLDFMLDPADLKSRAEWNIGLNEDRAFAARILSDLCTSFILTHEFGHILCGHLEAMESLDGTKQYSELLSYLAQSGQKVDEDRYRSWERDADAVATSLSLRFVEELIKDSEHNAQTRAVFHAEHETVEHIVSITVSAIFALFSYVRGARYALKLDGTHPHPFVRAQYIKNMLFHAVSDRWQVDQTRLSERIDERLDEMMIVLEENDLSESKRFTDAYLVRADEMRTHLDEIQFRYREICKPWTWIEWQ